MGEDWQGDEEGTLLTERKKRLWESGWIQLKVKGAGGQLRVGVWSWTGEVWAGGKGRNGEEDPPPLKRNLSFPP